MYRRGGGGSGGGGSGPAPGGGEREEEDPELEVFLATAVEMGFTANAAKRALAQSRSTEMEARLGWLSEHSEDADIDDPLPGAASPGR